jgi:hypothetical protein
VTFIFVPGLGAAETEGTDALIDRLETLIERAERDRAADPNFLRDLRDALEDFEGSQVVAVIVDDFSDGDYTRNPRWSVVEGNFSVERNRGLRSDARAQAASAGPPEPASVQNLRARIQFLEEVQEEHGPGATAQSTTLPRRKGYPPPDARVDEELARLRAQLPAAGPGSSGNPEIASMAARIQALEGVQERSGRYTLVRSTTLNGNPQVPVREELARVREVHQAAVAREEASRGPSRAEIAISQTIPNAFQVNLLMSTALSRGQFSVDIFQGQRRAAGYRLIYHASGRPSFELFRYGRRGVTRIAQYRRAVQLDDSRNHNLSFSRDANGRMTATIDDRHLFTVTDRRFRDPFNGLTWANVGGDFAVRKVTVHELGR